MKYVNNTVKTFETIGNTYSIQMKICTYINRYTVYCKYNFTDLL